MAETDGTQSGRESLGQDMLGVLIASYEMHLISNYPLFAEVKRLASQLSSMRFETRDEAEAAAREAADRLDKIAQANQLIRQEVIVESPHIWVQVPEQISADSPDLLMRTRLLTEEESAIGGRIADKGKFYGFTGWTTELEDEQGVYRPVLAFHTIRGGTGSPFVGPYLYSVSEISPETEIHFERDRLMLEIKETLMTLAGKDEAGKNQSEALVDRNDLMNLATVLNVSFSNAYDMEVFAKISEITGDMKISGDSPDNKNKALRALEKMILLGLNLGQKQAFNVTCNRVVDKQLGEFSFSKRFDTDIGTTHGETKVSGPVLGIDFMPVLAEGQGFVMTSPKLFPHFMIEEQFDGKGKEIPEKERRLRYVPLQSISDFTLLKG